MRKLGERFSEERITVRNHHDDEEFYYYYDDCIVYFHLHDFN